MIKKSVIFKILILSFVFVALFVVSTYAATSDELEYYYSAYGKSFGSGLLAPNVSDGGDGVDVSRAAIALNETDYVIKGKNGLEIPIMRRYNVDAQVGFIYGKSSTKKNVVVRVGYWYNNVTTGTRLIVGFPDEFTAFQYRNGFVGYDETKRGKVKNHSVYYWEINNLVNQNGTCTYERDMNADPVVIYMNGYYTYHKQTMIDSCHMIDLGSAWGVVKPGLKYWDEDTGSSSYRYYTYIFQDIYGKSFNVEFTYYDNGTSYRPVSQNIQSEHRDYKVYHVSSSDMSVTNTHPQGFEYNVVFETTEGLKYYFYFSNFYNMYLRGIDDRFGNTFLFTNPSATTAEINYTDCSTGISYKVDKSGIYIIANGVTTKVVEYEYEVTTSTGDPQNDYWGDDILTLTIRNLESNSSAPDAKDNYVVYSMNKKLMSSMFLNNGTVWSERMMLTGHYISEISYSNGMKTKYSHARASSVGNIYKYNTTGSYDTIDDVQYNKNTYSYTTTYEETAFYDNYFCSYDVTSASMSQYSGSDTVGISHSYSFDSYGRLTSHSERQGTASSTTKTTSHSYNCGCFDAPFKKTTVTYKQNNASAGSIATDYTYSSNHNPTKITTGAHTVQYTYGNYNQLTQIIEQKDASTQVKTVNTLSEDKKSVAKTEVYEGNMLKEEETYVCNSDGTLASKNIYQSNGAYAPYTYEYQCDSDGNMSIVETLSGLTDADANMLSDVVVQTTTDIQGNIILHKDGKGNVTRYEYDLMNRPVKIIYPDNTFVSYSYDDIANITEATDALGNKIRVKFDPWGNRLETSYQEDENYIVLEDSSYDYRRRLSTYKSYTSDAEYNSSEYTYDWRDRVLSEKVKDASGNVVRTVTYTYAHLADSSSRPSFKVTQQASDSGKTFAKSTVVTNYLGHPVSKTLTDTSGNSRVYSYVPDYFGNVLSVTAPDSSVQSYTYDHAGNVLTYTNQLSDTMSYAYDMAGNNISSTDFNGNTTNTCYDLLGRPVMVTSPLTQTENSVTKTYYDANGNITRQSVQTDSQAWRNTDYAYDSMNRLSYVTTYPDSTTTEVTQYFYDANGNVTHMIVGLAAPVSNVSQIPSTARYITYSYDALGRCIATGGNLSVAKSYEYDYAGNVTKLTKPMGAVVKTYGPFGNAISIAEFGASSPEATYSYNALGLRTSMTDDTGTTTYTYDDFGNLLTETNGDIIKTSTYDTMGNRLSFAVTKDGVAVVDNSYTYDLAGRMSSVTSNGQTVTYTYDANGNVLSETGATRSVVNTYNSAGMLENVLNKAGDAVVSEYSDITYDFSGFMTSYADSVNNSTVSYTYDGNGRLKTETNNGVGDMNYMVLYNYDLLGNRASVNKTYGDATTENHIYTYSDYNQLASLIETDRTDNTYSTSYLYNTNGDMIGKTKTNSTSEAVLQQSYAFDIFGKLTQSTTDNILTDYTYDGDGIRVSKTTNNVTTSHILDGMNVVADINGTTVSKYNRGLNLFAQTVGDEQTILYNNQHGDIAAEYVSADDVNYFTYDGFGNHTDNASISTPFGYAGEYQDLCSGLIYLRNRYYDPSIGRFISEDPIRSGTNWYVYCSNNPVNLIDPLGLFDYDDRLGPSTEYNIDVKVMQNELAWLGYYSGEIDGYFGQKTLDAVNAYKNAMGLGNTGSDWGVVGVQTWSSMGLIYRTQADIDAGVKIVNGGLKQYFDISKPVTSAVESAKSEFANHYLDIDWFIKKVKNAGEWNVKRDANVWAKTLGISKNSYNTTMIFYGRPVVIDDIGNITYGYLGKAAGFSATVLKGGSMGYHILNHGLTDFGNEFSDEAFVQLGVDWYNGKDIQVRFSAP